MTPKLTSRSDTGESTNGFQVLQLPESALAVMLQHLDPCNRSCMAVTSRKLSQDVPASMCKVEVRWVASETYESFVQWRNRHSSSLGSLTQCSISGDARDPLAPDWVPPPCHILPFAHLRQLRLHDLKVQLEVTDGCPGVLHGCSGLTALDLQKCVVEDPSAAFAAIAALPELQYLKLDKVLDPKGMPSMPEIQRLSKLTYLSINCSPVHVDDQHGQLIHLSALVNLESLGLSGLALNGIPGGVPSQLSKLTRLSIQYSQGCDDAEQFKHLSSLTALQDLAFGCATWGFGSARIPRIHHQIQRLSQLTSLSLSPSNLEFNTTNNYDWTCLTALESLTLRGCSVQPLALAAFTQLRALTLGSLEIRGGAPFFWMHPGQELLSALSKLSQLTEMCWEDAGTMSPHPPADAFTAITASTNLHSLQLQLGYYRQGCVLFKPGTVYPHLWRINLKSALSSQDAANSKKQLQQLCSSCPGLESLSFRLWTGPPPTACLPLLQLSALTHLDLDLGVNMYLHTVSNCPDTAAAAALGVTAQLTGLKHLQVSGLPKLPDTALLPLTALTALEQLGVVGMDRSIQLNNKARWCYPPDVRLQLLCRLLRDAACRQELLKRSGAAAAAPAELMLVQLAASLAGELAAGP